MHPTTSVLISIVLSASALAQQSNPIHLEVKPGPIETEPTNLKKLQQRITTGEANTKEMLKNAHADYCPRTVIFDWSAALNQEEHNAISEGCVVMLLAVSQDLEEIPLKLAYVDRGDEKPILLVKIGQLPESVIKRLKFNGVFGTHAWAGLYWLPAIRHIQGKVRVDFSKNREDFSIGWDLPPNPKMFNDMKDSQTEFPRLPNAAVKAMAEREFPGFEFDKEFLIHLQTQSTSVSK